MSAVKIVYAAQGFGGKNFSGGPTFSRWDALAALANTAEVVVIGGGPPEFPPWFGMRVESMPRWISEPQLMPLLPQLDRSLPSRVAAWLCDVARDAKFRRRLSQMKPDILWIEDPVTHRMIERWGGCPSVKRVIMLRGSPDQFSGRYRGTSELDRVVSEIATVDFIASVSARVASQWKQIPRLSTKEILLLPNCAREEEAAKVKARNRDDIRRELGWPLDMKVALCPATIQRRKGQDVLLRQISRVRAGLLGWHFVLAGECMSDAGGDEIVRLWRELSLESIVSLPGHLPQMLEAMHACDLVILPSREEAMPLALLEAMVFEKPIVAAAVSGIPELVENEKHALLFEHDNPDALGQLLARITGDLALRTALGAGAGKRYQEDFCRDRQMARYADAVRTVLGA